MTARFIPHDVAIERYERLRRVIERSSRLANESRVGVVEEVVIEGPSKKQPDVTTGRTRRNTVLHFKAHEPLRVGSYAEVRVTEAAAHHLLGEFQRLVREPRHRTRIPVTAG